MTEEAEERIARVYNGQSIRGMTIGNGYDVDIYADHAEIYDVARKKWGKIELLANDKNASETDALDIAIDIASCPGDWQIDWDE
jgi:hypothetical protein